MMRGFSLTELVVTIAIVGVLAAIAVPSYSSYRLKVNRGIGKECLAEVQRRLEGYYTRKNTYTTTLTALGYSASPLACGEGSTVYSITITDAANNLACCYTLVAAPQGGQTNDGTLTLAYDSRQANPANRTTKTRTVGSNTLAWD